MAQMQMRWPPVTLEIKIIAGVLFGLWFGSLMVPALGDLVGTQLLVSAVAVSEGRVWTVLTYAFFHADFMHLLFNCGVLWLFGGELSAKWSAKKWWGFNLACALGGGVAVVGSQFVLGVAHPTLGYSGAVMGVVAAFAWENWDRRLYLFFVPMTGKTLLLVFIAFDVLLVVVGREPISIAAHLGGLVTGLLLATGWWRPTKWKRSVKRYRQRRRFKVIRREAEAEQNRRYLN